MTGYELSDEEIYGLDEDDTEEEKLRSKVEKLKMENEDLKDEVYYLKKQKKDTVDYILTKMYRNKEVIDSSWLSFDTLLKMLSDE